jgi:hypothetical protein
MKAIVPAGIVLHGQLLFLQAKNDRMQPSIDFAQAQSDAGCLNEIEETLVSTARGGAMIAALILALAVLTAALVIGVFVVALIELNEIDDITEGSGSGRS